MTLQRPGAPKVGTRDAAAAASRVFVRLRKVIGSDLRSLALFRIALACGLLFDLATRARDLTAHYTDHGTLPAAEVVRAGVSHGSPKAAPARRAVGDQQVAGREVDRRRGQVSLAACA